jgi:hAT family C-terminal dimerisation region
MEPDIFEVYMRPTIPVTTGDYFDSYINSPRVYIERNTTIQWWNEATNPWRAMRQQVFDLLSIPAMSTEIERVFSSVRLLLTPQRNRMTDTTIEMLELLRNWIKQDITISKFSSSTPPALPNRESRKRKEL